VEEGVIFSNVYQSEFQL